MIADELMSAEIFSTYSWPRGHEIIFKEVRPALALRSLLHQLVHGKKVRHGATRVRFWLYDFNIKITLSQQLRRRHATF